MKELARSTNPVFVSWLDAALKAEGIQVLVLDQHMSVLEGSLGILPRRVMVGDDDFAAAKDILSAACASFDDD